MDRDTSNFPSDPKRYRIVEVLKPNESEPDFHIQVLRRFLWWTWWEYVTHTYHAIGSAGDSTKIAYFYTKEGAERNIYLWVNKRRIKEEQKERLKKEAVQDREGTKIKYHEYNDYKIEI